MAATTPPLHRREFPKLFWLPSRLVEAFAAHGWKDTSYRHDACPTFEKDGTAIFCDVHDRRRRELGGGGFKRFQIVSPLAIDVNNFETTDALIEWLETS